MKSHWTDRIVSATALSLAVTVGVSAQAEKTYPQEWKIPGREEERPTWTTLEGKEAPSLEGLTGWLNTDARSWEDLKGKVVLLDYWATWCGPCRAGLPKLVELHEKFSDQDFEIVGVHSARGWEKMEQFVEDEKLPWAFAADPSRVLGEELGIKYIPSYFLIDRNGVMRVAGANPEHFEQAIRTLIDEPAAPTTTQASAGWPKAVEKNLYANDFRGKKAPEFAVGEWLTDEPKREGKVVLIDFWATWCGPCVKAIPHMNEFQEQFKDDLVVIGVSAEEPSTVKGFMETTEMHYPQAIDQKRTMSDVIGIKGIPHVIVISTDGVVRWQGFPGDPTDPLTAEVIAQVIENDPGVKARREAEKKQASATGG